MRVNRRFWKMEKITSELTGIRTAAIAGHVRPDGD